MDHPMDIDDDDFEPTPLALPHQMVKVQAPVHRVVSHNFDDDARGQAHAQAQARASSSKTRHLSSTSTKGRFTTGTKTKTNANTTECTALPLVIGSPEHLISDSDGAGEDDDDNDDGDDDDDFHSANSKDDQMYIQPQAMDVIFGRGQPLRDHPGNMRMRDVIKRYTTEYRNANKQRKTIIIQQIQHAIVANGARFLVPHNNQDPLEGCQPAAQTEIRAKISHGLRDAIKVEDLLDSEFVQLWANDSPMVHDPLSVDVSPLSFHQGPVTIGGSPPPPLTLGPPPALMRMPTHHSLSLNSQNFSYFNQQSSLLANSGRSASMGPAIFHVAVPAGTADLPKEKLKDNDDDLTLEISEKGFSASHQDSHPQANAIAVSAVLAAPDESRWSKYYRVILVLAVCVILSLVVLLAVSYSNNDSSKNGSDDATVPIQNNETKTLPTLDQILAKGYLSCGVANQMGYSSRNTSTNRVEGFEVDLCRAIAAAIFGKARFGQDEPVEYIFVQTKERFSTLADGDIDVLFAITTYTMERQVFEPSTKNGYSFSKPYLHNGLMFAGLPTYLECAESLNVTSGICQGTKICVLDGTTHRTMVANVLPAASVITAPTFDAFHQIFSDGGCNVLAGEKMDLLTGHQEDVESGEFVVGTNLFSKEPIALVTRNDDQQFSDFCNWIIQALITAEELRAGGPSTSLSDLPTPSFFGDSFSYMFYDALSLVGDYGEVYERHLEQYVPRSDANRINAGDSPAMLALPFGNLQPDVVPNVSGGRLGAIRDRGHLRCGISPGAVFAEFDGSEWSGLDISFCQALSAALFDGGIYVRYTVLDPTERFRVLQDGLVDVLARITTHTMERDVLEPSISTGLTFSPPNFHDEIRFAGIPPFHLCADHLNTTSDECQDLLVCVTKNTTQSQRLGEMIDSQHILETSDTFDTVERFVNGDCNAIVGGVVEIAQENILNLGYTGEYALGPTAYSRESLALVTTEEDVIWSNFVYWVVMATIYAEEQNITSATFQKMPRVDLFQPLVNDGMFRNAIRAVGSYAEIWDRATSRQKLERKSRNLLNALPKLGPQLYSDLLWDKAMP